MPFLRLTRDRRGFENTFLLHADHPGDSPRLLYWYRTAPGILLGRPPLDEDAIRAIEEQHPDIEFDWPAILALNEVMTPEDEPPPPRRDRGAKPPRHRDSSHERHPASSGRTPAGPDDVDGGSVRPGRPAQGHQEPDREETEAPFGDESTGATADADRSFGAPDLSAAARGAEADDAETAHPSGHERMPEFPEDAEPDAQQDEVRRPSTYGLLEELVGREIATRLRARYSEIGARIHDQYADALLREAWMQRAAPLNPDLWLTPDAILHGVRQADGVFERLRTELLSHSSRE